MRISKAVTTAVFLTFSHNNGVTRDTRSITILDATKDEIGKLIQQLYSDELQRRDEPIRNFVKLTVKIVEADKKTKQKKDEFSYRLYRTNVNAIEKIIEYID